MRPAGLTVTASHAPVLVSLKKTQKAVAPPALSQTVPPVADWVVQGRPRGLNFTGAPLVLPSRTVRPEPFGKNCPLRLAVPGALAAASGVTSGDIAISGSPASTPVPPLLLRST